MKSNIQIGIEGYGAYIPVNRLATAEIGRVWHGGGSGANREKAVASVDEDTTTMAVESGRIACEMAGVNGDLGAIFVGTESKVYAVKPTSTIVAQALRSHNLLAADFEFACKAGTEAMQIITGLVGSGMIQHGLAIAVDTAQGRPGDDLEYTAASGGAAFVIGKAGKDTVAKFQGSVSYVSDTGDFWRRQGEKYPKHLSRFTGEPAYFHHVETAVKNLFSEFGVKPTDFQYAVFHQPNPRFPVEAATRLGFTMKQIETGLLNPMIGNTYSGSSPLGLAAVLDVAQPGDKIMLVSFGSGAGSDAFIIEAEEALPRKRKNGIPVRTLIENSTKIDYAIYTKYREKIRR
ncbi:MAG: hydroxymethylglutaryl-CoA synthase [Thaumarchaeota archaeon]|nr:hydroxymethylglutaryl-CoA synthase [Nitrososphaerota archaeon]